MPRRLNTIKYISYVTLEHAPFNFSFYIIFLSATVQDKQPTHKKHKQNFTYLLLDTLMMENMDDTENSR